MTSPADDPAPTHYFSESPPAESDPTTVDVILPDVSLRLGSDRGVFSRDELDAGTKLLLLEMPELTPEDRTVLDLGCGWGPIACVAARRAPNAAVWAVDVNRRALELTAANAERAGVRLSVARPEEVPPDLEFDRILSNPPIRIGKQALQEMVAGWLDRLTTHGRAHLVVNRNLGSDSLAEWAEQRGHHVSRLVSRLGYRILEIRARGSASATVQP